MNVAQYFRKLIQVDSGESSKAFFLVSVTVVGCLMLLAVVFVLVWEVVSSGTVKTNLEGLASLVWSIAGVLGLAISGKVAGDWKEKAKTPENGGIKNINQ